MPHFPLPQLPKQILNIPNNHPIMTIISNHHPDLVQDQDADNNDTSHLGGRPTNHYPTDDDRPVGTTTNGTTTANFADDTSHLG
jgi:hypothetical protein